MLVERARCSASVEALEPRNATEDAILAAARKRWWRSPTTVSRWTASLGAPIVSRTAVYFYFPNKRAVVDRLIQQAFSDMYEASSPYLDGDGEPRLQLRLGLARMVSCVNAHGPGPAARRAPLRVVRTACPPSGSRTSAASS